MHPPSTKNKLIVSIGLILSLGFLAINLANYYVSKKSVREALISNELPLTSNNIYSEIQTSLLRPIYISSLMAHDTFLKDWMLNGERNLDEISKYLKAIRDRYNVFSTFVVSNLTQRYYHFKGVLKTVSPGSEKDAWFFSMEQHPEDYRVDVDTNEAAKDRLSIFINHKLYDYEGNYIGVTGLGLDTNEVSELIQRYKKIYQRNIYLVDRNGLVKGHEDNALLDKYNIRERPGLSEVAGQLLSKDAGFLEYPLDGDSVLLTYRFIPELDWYLVVEQRESQALREIRNTLIFNSGLSLVIIVVVLLISGYTVNVFQTKLETMARTDKLTGFYNRQYFDALFENVLRTVVRNCRRIAIIVFDIDSFKMINDQHGHLAGDAVIRAVAECAQSVIRSADVISRWGGDEFIVLLQDCDEAQAYNVAEKLRLAVCENVRVTETQLPVTISLGVTQHRAGDTYDSLIERADAGLYQAKQNGRNQTQLAGPRQPGKRSVQAARV